VPGIQKAGGNMKITDIKVIPLFIPLKETPPFSISGKASNYHVLIKVFTDEEIVKRYPYEGMDTSFTMPWKKI
jgi:hypothetical protein